MDKSGTYLKSSITENSDETILNDPEDLREWCKERISRWKIPRYIFFTDSFPVTPSGKIQKYKLQEKYIKDLSMS